MHASGCIITDAHRLWPNYLGQPGFCKKFGSPQAKCPEVAKRCSLLPHGGIEPPLDLDWLMHEEDNTAL